ALSDRRDDLGQDVDRAQAMIKLAAAVVRDVDAFDAFIACERRVLAGADALEDEPDGELVADAPHVVPVERRLELHSGRSAAAAPPAPRVAEPLGDVALAAAVDRAVDGDAEGVVTEVDRLADLVVDPVGLAARVELEDLRAAGGFADGLHAGFGYGAQDE